MRNSNEETGGRNLAGFLCVNTNLTVKEYNFTAISGVTLRRHRITRSGNSVHLSAVFTVNAVDSGKSQQGVATLPSELSVGDDATLDIPISLGQNEFHAGLAQIIGSTLYIFASSDYKIGVNVFVETSWNIK